MEIRHHRTGEGVAQVDQANSGLITRDLRAIQKRRPAIREMSVGALVAMCGQAAEVFMRDDLPLGDSVQSPEDYVAGVSATTGLPRVLCRRNMDKISGVLGRMDEVLAGLSRGLDPSVLDRGYGRDRGRLVSYCPLATCLGAVLPSNSPGVHSLWLPAVAMKMVVALKPGGQEPWTPYRVFQALIRAGCPADSFGYYPCDHAAGRQILQHCRRSMVFGDESTTRPWSEDPRVQVHGPGYSKILLGADAMADWPQYLDVMVESILGNAGRSCINASAVWVPSHGREVAEALAERLAVVDAKPAEDPDAQLAAFGNPGAAERISRGIDEALAQPGAEDLTVARRGGARMVRLGRCAYLLPTIIYCRDAAHPLANREFLFPYAAVVEAREEEVPAAMGRSLVVSVITENKELIERLLNCPEVDRLNIGPIPTNAIRWDQPHEGNLFEHLYHRRAFQLAGTAEPSDATV